MSDLFQATPKRVVECLHKNGAYAFRLPYVNGYSASRGDAEYRLIKDDGTYKVLTENEVYSTTGVPMIELWRSRSVQTGVRRELDAVAEHMPVEEYQTKREILGPKVEVEIDGELCRRHATLAEELAYKDFTRGWRAVYEQRWQLDCVLTFEVIEDPEWSNRYIVPARHLGDDFTSKFASYARKDFLKDHFTKIMTEFGYSDQSERVNRLFGTTVATRYFSTTYWDHSQELTLKIGDHIILKEAVRGGGPRDTFEVCLAKYEADKAWLEKQVGTYLSSLSTVITAASLKFRMQRALALASVVTPMKASVVAKRDLVRYLTEQIAKADDHENLVREGDNAPDLGSKAVV